MSWTVQKQKRPKGLYFQAVYGTGKGLDTINPFHWFTTPHETLQAVTTLLRENGR